MKNKSNLTDKRIIKSEELKLDTDHELLYLELSLIWIRINKDLFASETVVIISDVLHKYEKKTIIDFCLLINHWIHFRKCLTK